VAGVTSINGSLQIGTSTSAATGSTVAGGVITAGPIGTGTLTLRNTSLAARNNPVTLANNISRQRHHRH